MADGLEAAALGVHDFLDGEAFWDEEKAYDNTPTLEVFQDAVAGEDLATFLAGMRIGEPAELHCEDGTFEIVRDR